MADLIVHQGLDENARPYVRVEMPRPLYTTPESAEHLAMQLLAAAANARNDAVLLRFLMARGVDADLAQTMLNEYRRMRQAHDVARADQGAHGPLTVVHNTQPCPPP